MSGRYASVGGTAELSDALASISVSLPSSVPSPAADGRAVVGHRLLELLDLMAQKRCAERAGHGELVVGLVRR